MCLSLLLCIVAFFIPPLGVVLKDGCTVNVLINVLLTLLGLIPGIIHAWYIILCYERPHTTNVYITTPQPQPEAPPRYYRN